jgi:Ser/Thr protein kinase RdoA (MazF antagonist)
MSIVENETQRNEALSVRWENLAPSEAELLCLHAFGVGGAAKRLASEKDDTFRVTSPEGVSYTLKVANPKEDAEGLEFQDGALIHLERVAPEVRVPRLIKTLSGENRYLLASPHGGARIVRLLSYLDGQLLSQTSANIAQCSQLGRAFARFGSGLSNYKARPVAKILWDISHLSDLRSLLGHIHLDRRSAVEQVIENFEKHVSPVAHGLRRQIIHNDLNPHNILVDDKSPDLVTGIIDFGDMVEAPLVNDLAVAVSYQLSDTMWLERLCALVEGYHAVTPLEYEEFLLLPYLIKARLAMTIAITEWRSSERPEERAYILRNHPASWKGLEHLNSVPEADLTKLLISSCKD